MAVSAPVPPNPVEEPISYLDEPGGGGKKTGCYITKEHGAPAFWCVRYDPNPQTNKNCDFHSADAAERWKKANCR